jgi:hypothetical protein
VPDFACLARAFCTIIKPDAKDNFYMATMLVGLHFMVLLVCELIGGLLFAGNHLSG